MALMLLEDSADVHEKSHAGLVIMSFDQRCWLGAMQAEVAQHPHLSAICALNAACSSSDQGFPSRWRLASSTCSNSALHFLSLAPRSILAQKNGKELMCIC